METTANTSLLKRWFNPFPVAWFGVQKIIQRLADSLNAGIDKHIITEIAKVLFYNKVLKLQALYMGIYNLIKLKPQNDSWGITKKKKTNLSYYLSEVEKHTGIIIKDLDGLEKLNKEVTRQKDKYIERYGGEIKQDNSIPFIQYAFSIFALMEMPYNQDMVLSEFSNLVKVAEKKIKELDKLKAKHGKH